MRPVPLRRTCVGHRLDDLIFRGEECGAALGFVAHGAKCGKPIVPRIAGRADQRQSVIFHSRMGPIARPGTRHSGSMRHHEVR